MKIKNIMKSKMFVGIVVSMLCFSLNGCATMFTGVNQKVSFSSNPSGATVMVNGKKHTTPCKVKLPRKKFHVATFSKENYDTAEFAIRRKPNNATLVNFFWYGLMPIGLLIGVACVATDEASGAAYWLDTKNVFVTLTPTAPGRAPSLELKN